MTWKADIMTGTPADGCDDSIATAPTFSELLDELKKKVDVVEEDLKVWPDMDYLMITHQPITHNP